eukprot:13940534-Alexandrium_andersonii.AAC.1
MSRSGSELKAPECAFRLPHFHFVLDSAGAAHGELPCHECLSTPTPSACACPEFPKAPVSYTHLTLPTICSV